MLDVNIHKTNTLKRKKAMARITVKKSTTLEWNTCFGPRDSKIVYQNSRLCTIPTFNMIKVYRYDNRGKITRTSSKVFESIKIKIIVYLPWKMAKISPTSRCLKEEISHKMCWHFSRHFHYGFRYAALKIRIRCVCLMNSLRNMPESLETVNSGRFGNRSAIFLENNSSRTSQLSLNIGIFRTVYLALSVLLLCLMLHLIFFRNVRRLRSFPSIKCRL